MYDGSNTGIAMATPSDVGERMLRKMNRAIAKWKHRVSMGLHCRCDVLPFTRLSMEDAVRWVRRSGVPSGAVLFARLDWKMPSRVCCRVCRYIRPVGRTSWYQCAPPQCAHMAKRRIGQRLG